MALAEKDERSSELGVARELSVCDREIENSRISRHRYAA